VSDKIEKEKLTMDAMLREALRKYNGLRQQLDNVLLGENGDEWEAEFKKFLAKRPCWVKEINPYLKKIGSGILPATDGKRTLAQASNIFKGYLDPDFYNWKMDVKGQPTKEMPFEIFELVKDGTFNQVFGAFGVELDKLYWSQDQVISFIEKHADLLHLQNHITFLLFKVDNGFFVVDISSFVGQLGACTRCLSSDIVWHERDRGRFVVPQLTKF
jgi:hypothetical protein